MTDRKKNKHNIINTIKVHSIFLQYEKYKERTLKKNVMSC